MKNIFTKKNVTKYLFLSGIIIHLVLALLFVNELKKLIYYGKPLPVYAANVKTVINVNYPLFADVMNPLLSTVINWQEEIDYNYHVDPLTWQGVGANVNLSPLKVTGHVIRVYSTDSLSNALDNAKAGDNIELLPGVYEVTKSRIDISGAGSAALPITLFSQKLGDVIIKLRGEGFVVDEPYWHFQNLYFIGNCQVHTRCEHAFHVVGKGNNTTFKNNIFQDFNAMIKINGFAQNYPDNGTVIGNTFYNTSPRKTANPVTPIDLMHANNWQVSENFIFDFLKSGGDKISYGAFLKGGSTNGKFSNNLVMCRANLDAEYVAIGLSLGGGGSSDKSHRSGNKFEHKNGVIRNNIIMNCPNDVGIYLNKAADTIIKNNILYNTLGIDVRFKESNAFIMRNILSGRIKSRSSGSIEQKNNMVFKRSWITGSEPLMDFFQAPNNGDFSWKAGNMPHNSDLYELEELTRDFCGKPITTFHFGAYSGNTFCKEKMNLTNPLRKFKLSKSNEE